MIGRTLSHYRVTAKIGSGGMGEVYRATDTRLGRDVAIKVLPEAFARDSERLARMGREARSLAALNHPNIAAIHGLEEADGIQFLVLELVEGQTLSERMAQRPLPLPEVVHLGRQIAAGLEAAHNGGIVHRDLKPDNIKIAPAGEVKILDFGLAKIDRPGTESSHDTREPTRSMEGTADGAILGTPTYMSPEQVRGQAVDKRADIWALGCIIFELVTGHRAFRGPSVPDTLAAILTRDPDWHRLPASVPPRLALLLHRCLAKEPQNRLRDAGDARIELEEALAAPTAAADEGRTSGRRWKALLVLSAVVSLGLGASIAWLLLSRQPAPEAPGWSGDLLVGGTTVAWGPHLSPDGQTLAFVTLVEGMTQVAVTKPGAGTWSVLSRDTAHGYVDHISWSPDGSRIYFDRASAAVYSVPSLGGEERLVLEGAWGPEALPDGSLLVSRREPDGTGRFWRFWPADARLVPVGPKLLKVPPRTQPIRAFSSGDEAVFVGILAGEPASASVPSLHYLDLTTGNVRTPAISLAGALTQTDAIPLAIGRDDREVITAVPAGDLFQVIALDRAGGPSRPLLSLTRRPWVLDVRPDGTIYVDQTERPEEIVSLTTSGGVPTRVARSVGASWGRMAALRLSDGRVLFSSGVAERSQLLVSRIDGNPAPFVETSEQTGGPAIVVGSSQVAFFVGPATDPVLALATIDGRLVRRFPGVAGGRVTGMAASPDGKTLYMAESGTVWAVSLAGGDRRRVCSGDSIAIDPRTGELLVIVRGTDRLHLSRVSPIDGSSRELMLRGGHELADWFPVTGRSIDGHGRVVATIQFRNSWFDRPGLIDLATGAVSLVNVSYDGDIEFPSWEDDRSIIAVGVGIRGAIWRLRPTAPPR
jgi:eukaryotic-like serine/threonine-protein kinase